MIQRLVVGETLKKDQPPDACSSILYYYEVLGLW
jgi:hypothetical protein